MAVLSSDLIRQGAAGASTGYTIDQSIRFNAAATAYMHRTPSSTGNRKKFTSSFWVKLGNVQVNTALPTPQVTHGVGSSGLALTTDGTLTAYTYYSGSWSGFLKTRRSFRDPSAWYHFVYVVDSTQSTTGERIRIYVNGERESSFSTESYLAQNQDTDWNLSGEKMWIGRDGGGSGYDGDYYAADIYWLDGYAYGPEYFGEFNENGIWIPKEYDGSYGTNGFFIDGRDASDLGDDESGNGNDFTTVSFGTDDKVLDTPTNNKITFNPLNNQQSGGTVSNGNMDYKGPGTRTMIGTTGGPFPTSGKWAIAFKAGQVGTDAGWSYGLQKADDADMGDAAGSNEDIGAGTGGANFSPFSTDGYAYNYSTSTATDPSLPLEADDEFWLAVDIGTGKYWFGIYDASASGYKWVAADAGLDGDPGAGSNETGSLTGLQNNTGNFEFIFSSKQTNQNIYLQREADLAGAVPTGFTYWENVKDLI